MGGPVGPVIADIRPATVTPAQPQRLLLDYTAWMMAVARCARERIVSKDDANRVFEETRARVHEYGVSEDRIASRQACLAADALRDVDDMGGAPPLPALFADLAQRPTGPALDARMEAYRRVVTRYFTQTYADEDRVPDGIVSVTCSGYLSPSPAQCLASARGWGDAVVTHAFHMGCYAAFPAVRIAIGQLASAGAEGLGRSSIDVVHSEPLSLHFDVSTATPHNIINTTLFGDGFVRYRVLTADEAERRGVGGLRLRSSHEVLLPDSTQEMAWTPGAFQFDMHLSREVPRRIGEAVGPFVETLCRRAGFDFAARRDDVVFAVHPGGPRILDYVAERLSVAPARMRYSREVLAAHGNMSSATVPHVWKRIIDDDDVPAGTPVVTMAFGPGLTATGMVLEKC